MLEHQGRTPVRQSPCCGGETSPWALLSVQKEQKPTEIHLPLVFLGHGEASVVLAEEAVIHNAA